MPLEVGDTFFMNGTGGINNPAGSHLMICLVVDKARDIAIVVPLVSQHAYSDTSCTLRVGDHPFIKHDTCAAYDHLKAVSIAETVRKITSGFLILQKPVSSSLLIKLQVGLVTSDETQPWAFNEANGDALMAWLKHKGHIKAV